VDGVAANVGEAVGVLVTIKKADSGGVGETTAVGVIVAVGVPSGKNP
jgi:hypothetical protein